MNVVVVAESATSVVVAEALADHDVTTVESITDVSVGPDADTDVVVLSLSVPGADAFSTYASVPLIGIGSAAGSTADFYQLLEEPPEPAALRSALECVQHVVEYQQAVDELYALCRNRARGEDVSPRDLREARYSARERLQAVNRTGTPPLKQLLR